MQAESCSSFSMYHTSLWVVTFIYETANKVKGKKKKNHKVLGAASLSKVMTCSKS